MDTLEVMIDGLQEQVPSGITLEEISKEFQKDFKYPIILARVNGRIRELSRIVEENDDIIFMDLTSSIGNRTHIGGLTFLIIYTVKELFGEGACRGFVWPHRGFFPWLSNFHRASL